MRERFRRRNRASWQLRFHTQTAGSTLTAQQPENNVVRVTLQALAAVLGRHAILHTNSRDEALWLPTENAVQLALRTQQVIAHESGVADTVDPLAGSYLIEQLTDEIESRPRPTTSAASMRWAAPCRPSSAATCRTRSRTRPMMLSRPSRRGEQIVVGVNQFQVEEQVTLERLQVDPAIEAAARGRLEQVRARRDAARAADLMGQVETAARGDRNMMPLFVECVEHDVTLGEICGVLRGVWGEYQARAF